MSRVLKHFGTKGKPEKQENGIALGTMKVNETHGARWPLCASEAGTPRRYHFRPAEIVVPYRPAGVREAPDACFRFGKNPGTTRSSSLSIA
jgi:hypothetical protein